MDGQVGVGLSQERLTAAPRRWGQGVDMRTECFPISARLMTRDDPSLYT